MTQREKEILRERVTQRKRDSEKERATPREKERVTQTERERENQREKERGSIARERYFMRRNCLMLPVHTTENPKPVI